MQNPRNLLDLPELFHHHGRRSFSPRIFIFAALCALVVFALDFYRDAFIISRIIDMK